MSARAKTIPSSGSWRRKEAVYGYLLASPWILGFIMFTLGPLIFSLYTGFTEYRLADFRWVGLENYVNLFSDDPLFGKAVFNTVYYSFFAVLLGIIVALSIAMLLNMPLRGMSIFRTMFYLPRVTPLVAASLLWLYLMSGGALSNVLRALHLPTTNWLASPVWSKPALILMSLWGVGGSAIIFLAALQGVPSQLYEAAEIDGAGPLQRFLNITIPMISPTLFFTVVVGIIGALQTFTEPLVMTDGGPIDSTMFYVVYLYKTGFRFLEMGYASAMAWVLFVAILILTLLIFRSSAFWVYYEGRRQAHNR